MAEIKNEDVSMKEEPCNQPMSGKGSKKGMRTSFEKVAGVTDPDRCIISAESCLPERLRW